MYLSIFWFIREAKRSSLGFLNISEIFGKKWELNFKSKTLLKFLEKLSDSAFYIPGMCAAFLYIVYTYFVMYIWPIVLLQFHYKALIWLPLHCLHKTSLLCFHMLLWHVYSFFAFQYVCTAMNFAFSSTTSVRFISSCIKILMDFSICDTHSNVLESFWISVISNVWVKSMNMLKAKHYASCWPAQFFLQFTR